MKIWKSHLALLHLHLKLCIYVMCMYFGLFLYISNFARCDAYFEASCVTPVLILLTLVPCKWPLNTGNPSAVEALSWKP